MKISISLLAGMAMAAGGSAGAQERISISTGSAGGVYYLWGGALSSLWSDHLDGYQFNVEATTGQTQNLFLLESGDAEVGIYNIASAYQAWNGLGDFPGELREQRAMFAMYPSYTVMVALASSDVDSIEDWSGSSVSLGTPAGTADGVFRQIVETLGIEDVNFSNSGWPDVPGQVRDGLVDAVGAIGGQPWPPIADLQSTHDLTFFSMSEDQFATLEEEFPYFVIEDLPPTYDDQPESYPTLAFWNMAFVDKDLPEDVVYEMMQIVDSNMDRLEATHPSTAAHFDMANTLRVSPVPLHPGAVRYLEEQGHDVPADLQP